jgi:KipI family sensor histidine kinase inhibitor
MRADNFENPGRKLIFPRFASVGDAALSVEFEDEIDPAVNARVRALDRAIVVSNLPGIVETVPGFRALLIIYEPEDISLVVLVEALNRLIREELNVRPVTGRSWTIPVAYGFPTDDDLREISAATGLTRDDIIGFHSAADYSVYVVGFVPGMPVFGGLPVSLHVSRRADPRPGLPAGRVMIGGMQGLIVPMPMTTGYYSVGQTPLRPFARGAVDPFLFRQGDRIRFRPITVNELESLADVPGHRYLNAGTPE